MHASTCVVAVTLPLSLICNPIYYFRSLSTKEITMGKNELACWMECALLWGHCDTDTDGCPLHFSRCPSLPSEVRIGSRTGVKERNDSSTYMVDQYWVGFTGCLTIKAWAKTVTRDSCNLSSLLLCKSTPIHSEVLAHTWRQRQRQVWEWEMAGGSLVCFMVFHIPDSSFSTSEFRVIRVLLTSRSSCMSPSWVTK